MRSFYIALFFWNFAGLLYGQGTLLPLGSETYWTMERLEIETGMSAPFHSTLKYYLRGDMVRYAMQLDTSSGLSLSAKDRADLAYIFKDNNEWLVTSAYPVTLAGPKDDPVYAYKGKVDSTGEWSSYYYRTKKPILKIFYRTPANFYEIDRPFFHLRVNPIVNFYGGKTNERGSDLLFLNQRGFRIRGGIDDRIFFYTDLIETQARFPDYVRERSERDNAVPGAGFFKPYRSSIFDINDGYDFLQAQGYFGFNITKHVGMQLGHGRHFIGNGYRSLFLSDFSPNYFYLKLNWRVWRFHLQNIFAEVALQGAGDDVGDLLIPKKYFAAHYLSFAATPKLTVGFFESVVFSRNNQFELQYLNPVILYRTVEQLVGSPDNVLLGFEFKWNLLERTQLYGQVIFDEFKFDELFLSDRKWWGNKYGIQAGVKYVNVFGIDHLDAQAEFNLVRPYTYSHRDSSATYSNYNQPLAHPLGANFKEYILRLRYQATPKLLFKARAIRANTGEDVDGINYGYNVLEPTGNNKIEEGVVIGQGVRTEINLFGLEASYAFWHNMELTLEYFFRDKQSEIPERRLRTSYIGGGLRINIAKEYQDF